MCRAKCWFPGYPVTKNHALQAQQVRGWPSPLSARKQCAGIGRRRWPPKICLHAGYLSRGPISWIGTDETRRSRCRPATRHSDALIGTPASPCGWGWWESSCRRRNPPAAAEGARCASRSRTRRQRLSRAFMSLSRPGMALRPLLVGNRFHFHRTVFGFRRFGDRIEVILGQLIAGAHPPLIGSYRPPRIDAIAEVGAGSPFPRRELTHTSCLSAIPSRCASAGFICTVPARRPATAARRGCRSSSSRNNARLPARCRAPAALVIRALRRRAPGGGEQLPLTRGVSKRLSLYSHGVPG